jgi:hypothetical protein
MGHAQFGLDMIAGAIEDSLLAPFAFLAFCSFSLTGCPVLRGWLWCEA